MWTTSHLVLTMLLTVAVRHSCLVDATYAHAEDRRRTKLHHILENLRNNQIICMQRSKESAQFIIEMEIDRKPTFRLRCHCTNGYRKAKTLCYFFVPYEAKWLLASKEYLKGDGCVQKLRTKVEVRKSRLSFHILDNFSSDRRKPVWSHAKQGHNLSKARIHLTGNHVSLC